MYATATCIGGCEKTISCSICKRTTAVGTTEDSCRLTLIRLSWCVAAVFFIRQSITEMLSLQQADSRVYAAVHVVLG